MGVWNIILSFLGEQCADWGVEKGVGKLSEIAIAKSLEAADNLARESLAAKTTDVNYDIIDRFFAENGIYSYDQITENSAAIDALVEQTVKLFYKEYPKLQHNQVSTTPEIEKLIRRIYTSLLKSLSPGERVLYHQNIKHDEHIREDHEKLRRGVDTANEKIDSLQEAFNRLELRQEKLDTSEVMHIYKLVCSAINSGDFTLVASISNLMTTRIKENDKHILHAIEIFASCFLNTGKSVLQKCYQFLSDSPTEETLQDVGVFLLKMDKLEELKVVMPLIGDNSLKKLLQEVFVSDVQVFSFLIQEDRQIKEEYREHEYAFWALGNAARRQEALTSALQMYSVIEKRNGSFWAQWRKNCIIEKIAFAACLMEQSEETVDRLKQSVDNLLKFMPAFEQLNESLQDEFIEHTLECAEILPLDEFNRVWGKIPSQMAIQPKSKRQWYFAQLDSWKDIDEKELYDFCKINEFSFLWIQYLLRRGKDDATFVIEKLRDEADLLQREFLAVVAYARASLSVYGASTTIDELEALSLAQIYSTDFSVLLAQIADKGGLNSSAEYIEKAYKGISEPCESVSINSILCLANLLEKTGRWTELDLMLEKFENYQPNLKLRRIDMLIRRNEKLDTCRELLTELQDIGLEDAYLFYCQGILEDKTIPGSGCNNLIKAFRLSPTIRYAHAVLASRLNGHISIADDILSFASQQCDGDLQYLCALTNLQLGRINVADRTFLYALLLNGKKYHAGLFGAYASFKLGDSNHDEPPEFAGADTAIVLTETESNEKRKIWIHSDAVSVPAKSDFAEYTHISVNTPEALLLEGRRLKDNVFLAQKKYEVTAINHGDIIAVKYCMDQLLEHGEMKTIPFYEGDIDKFFEELKNITAPQDEHLQHAMDLYKENNPGIPLHLLLRNIGKPYLETLRTICLDPDIPLWAGCDGAVLNKPCLLTLSTIAVLSAIGVHPPANSQANVQFYITPGAKSEIELQIRMHRRDCSVGTIGFSADGKPVLTEITGAYRDAVNSYFACMLEWSNFSTLCRPVLHTEYPDDIKDISEAIGVPDIEAITLAKKEGYILLSDDLMLRRYLYSVDIKSATSIGVLTAINISPFECLQYIETLANANYRSPVTPELLHWFSERFSLMDEEASRNLSNHTGLVLKGLLENERVQADVLYVLGQVWQEGGKLNKTLQSVLRKTLFWFANKQKFYSQM